jgi:hypothetical protein
MGHSPERVLPDRWTGPRAVCRADRSAVQSPYSAAWADTRLNACVARRRTPEPVALALGAAHGAQQLGLLFSLDALGHTGQPQLVGQADDEVDELTVDRILGRQVPHEALVDLDLAYRQGPQLAERGMSGAKVVECRQHAPGVQGLQHPAGVLGVGHHGAFGDFDLQQFRRTATFLQGVNHLLHRLFPTELKGRDIDADGDAFAGTLPSQRLRAGLRQHPATQGKDQTRLLGQGNELGRAGPGGVSTGPARQGLGRHHFTTGQIHDGLVMHLQGLLLQGQAQRLLHVQAVAHRVEHGRGVGRHAVAARALLSVHGGIRPLQQLLGGLAVTRE